MSVTSRIVMSAAALTMVAGVGTAGTLTANAATAACSAASSNSCVNWHTLAYGPASPPTDVIAVAGQVSRVGQPIVLAAASGGNAGEDFQQAFQGTVSDFVAAGLMAPGLGTLYGDLPVYEIQYTPGGIASGLCVGVAATPSGLGAFVVLQPCGVNAKTTWILDPVPSSAPLEGSALINGATASSFDHPYSLTALVPGLPLVTTKLALNAPQKLRNLQLWAPYFGTLPVS
jgi:hypothetical protein